MRKILPLAAALAALAALPAGASAADVTCTGPKADTTVNGNLVVPAGAYCDLSSTVVKGDVRLEPGALFASLLDTTVLGAVKGTNVQAVSLFDSRVARGLQVSSASDSVTACNSSILGVTALDHVGFNVTLGDSSIVDGDGSLLCDGNRFAGRVSVTDTPGAVLLDRNAVLGNLTVSRNAASVQLKGNTVLGTLACAGNAFPPEGGQNQAVAKTGQCASL